jgi:hypothetical protein
VVDLIYVSLRLFFEHNGKMDFNRNYELDLDYKNVASVSTLV